MTRIYLQHTLSVLTYLVLSNLKSATHNLQSQVVFRASSAQSPSQISVGPPHRVQSRGTAGRLPGARSSDSRSLRSAQFYPSPQSRDLRRAGSRFRDAVDRSLQSAFKEPQSEIPRRSRDTYSYIIRAGLVSERLPQKSRVRKRKFRFLT